LGAGNTQAHQQELLKHFTTFPHFSPQRFGVYTSNGHVVKVKYSQKLTIFNLSKNGFRVSGQAKKLGLQGDEPGVLLELLEQYLRQPDLELLQGWILSVKKWEVKLGIAFKKLVKTFSL
jgi:hypothetical protein